MIKIVSLFSFLFFLTLGVSHAWALPDCVGSWSITNWTNCIGTYTWENGDKYVGEHKDGKSHGQGTFTWGNGDKYVGKYQDGKRHGQGTILGQMVQSTLVNGRMAKSMVKAPTPMPKVTNTLENIKMAKGMVRVPILMPAVTNT